MNHMELRLFLHKNIYNENTIKDLYKIIRINMRMPSIQNAINNRMGIIIHTPDKDSINTQDKINSLCKKIMFTWLSKYDELKKNNINLENQIEKIYSVGKLDSETIIIYL